MGGFLPRFRNPPGYRRLRMTMHRRLIPLVALIVCAAVAAPAQANFKVGIGDQDARMFDNPNFQSLKIKRIRYLVPVRLVQERRPERRGHRLHEPRRRGRRRRARPLHGPSWLLHQRPLLEEEVVPRAERADLPKRGQALPQGVPVRSRPSASGTRPTTSRSRRASKPKLAAKYFLAAAQRRAARARSSPPTCSTRSNMADLAGASSSATPRARRASTACTTTPT